MAPGVGKQCRDCGCTSRVTNSKEHNLGVVRTRTCIGCGRMWHTKEVPLAEGEAAPCVYVVRNVASGKLKIGTSKRFKVRLTRLRAMSGCSIQPVIVFHNKGRKFEQVLHKQFRADNVQYEWYNPEILPKLLKIARSTKNCEIYEVP